MNCVQDLCGSLDGGRVLPRPSGARIDDLGPRRALFFLGIADFRDVLAATAAAADAAATLIATP